MKRHPFTPAAQPLWDGVPAEAQARLLDNVWCGQCRSARRILDFTGVTERGNLRLQGFCAECGHVVVRLIEVSELPPHP